MRPTIHHPQRRSTERRRPFGALFLTAGLQLAVLLGTSESFSTSPRIASFSTTRLFGYSDNSLYTSGRTEKSYQRGSGGNSSFDRSKRQERVGQLVQTELSKILHSGHIKGYDVEYLDDELRQRISVVKSDVSPDLRQARISVSVRAAVVVAANEEDNSRSPAVDRRRAYAWLVRHTKQLRHTLAQRLSHMKSCPTLSFQQVDVSAAVDVMHLIDKLSSSENVKRQNMNLFDADDMARGIVGGMDWDEEEDDDDDDTDWEEVEDFFKTK